MAKGRNYPAGFGGGNMQQLMQQAQRMQQDMLKKQDEINAMEFTSQAGGGMVTATVTGAKELKSIEIKPECVDPDDIEMLQDLVVAAVNGALTKASEESEKVMGGITRGLNF